MAVKDWGKKMGKKMTQRAKVPAERYLQTA